MQQNTIKRFFDTRGFGFPDDGGSDIWFHVKGFASKIEPQVDQRVEFDLRHDHNGRSRAENLRLIPKAMASPYRDVV
jgi:cold shock protein